MRRLKKSQNLPKIIIFFTEFILLSIHIYGLNKAIYTAYISCEIFIQTKYNVCNLQTFGFLIFIGGGIIAAINHALFNIIIQVSWQ